MTCVTAMVSKYRIVKELILMFVCQQMETSGGSESSGGEDAEARRAKRGHVLAELMQTERVYVHELGSIISVSQLTMHNINGRD